MAVEDLKKDPTQSLGCSKNGLTEVSYNRDLKRRSLKP